MNYQDAIKKINRLLGLYNFNSYKIAETGEELICEGELAVDEPIYVITNNGQLPAPDGEYELEDTTKIKIQDGKVKELKYDMENETLSFAEATLKDGTMLKSPNFEIGDDVKIVDADGNETPAPDGEHEIVLKDSGVVMKIELEGGKITEKESVELPETEEEMGMEAPDLSTSNIETEGQIEEDFKKTIMEKIDTMMSKMEEMMSNYEDMKSKVEKFSKEPAGQPVRQSKNIINEFNEAKGDYISQLVKVRRSSYAK
jgi:hypothetical protein